MFVDKTSLKARLWSNEVLREIGDLFSGDAINVSGWQDEDKEGGRYRNYFRNCSHYDISNYVGGNRGHQGQAGEISLDLTATLPASLHGRYDVVFNHTTLEHVFDVRTAFKNLASLSKDIVIIIVPFVQLQHESESYKDYWRFTPSCMRALFQENGLEVVFEAINDEPNCASYLFYVGSSQPGRWKGKLPMSTPLSGVGSWIGSRPGTQLWRRIRQMIAGRSSSR